MTVPRNPDKAKALSELLKKEGIDKLYELPLNTEWEHLVGRTIAITKYKDDNVTLIIGTDIETDQIYVIEFLERGTA